MPLIVAMFAAQTPVTPVGSPLKVAPVAPVVVYVIFVISEFAHTVWAFVPTAELNVIVLLGLTVIVPEAVLGTPGQPPIIVTV